MSIKLNIGSVLSYYADNRSSVEVKGNTVLECLDYLINKFPDLKVIIDTQSGKLAGFIAISLNKECTMPQDLDKPVKDGDELSIEFQTG